MRNMNARQMARKLGEKYYETGLPCKNGHTAKKATISGACYQCTAEASAAWRKSHLDVMAAHQKKYREANREKVRNADRELKARARVERPEIVKEIKNRSYRKRTLEETGRVVRDNGLVPLSEILERLSKVHKNAIVYVDGYTKLQNEALFKCIEHDREFSVNVHNILRGANPCPQCNHRKSGPQEAISKLMSIFTPVIKDAKGIAYGKSEVDVYLPEKNIGIEFHGIYYHSHFDAEDEKKNKHKTFNKYKTCQEKGIRLITIFETEWEQRQPQIKRLLRNAIGKTKGKLMARKCELKSVPAQEAREFYERYHPQGGEGNGNHYGLYWKDRLVACMRFALGLNDRGSNTKREWTLARYATRINISGGASRLFKAFIDEQKPELVKSFSDNRYFSGAMYEQLGFVMELESLPDYQVWSQKLGLKPKSHYQRRVIQKRLQEHGNNEIYNHETDSRTEKEMTYLMGARRIYDCGKKRWIWRSNA